MFVQQLVNGLTVGSVYALIALGYTMVYGILEFINFAHGEIYMLGAYLAIIAFGFFTNLTLFSHSFLPIVVLIFLFAMFYAACYGATIERLAYRPLRGASRLSPLISAIGVSIFLQNFVMLTQGAHDKVFPSIFSQGAFQLGKARISYIQLLIMVISFLLMLGLTLFIQKTKLGKAMRATAQDVKMAQLVGINIDRVIATTFIIGSALGAAAGVMVAIYYGLVNFYIGYIAGLKAFIAAVLGGIGNIPGAMLGGLLLGMAESFGAGYLSCEYKDVYAFIILILVLLLRPQGILGERVYER
ncbi:MAG: branched-chain amino acid ABC transporter permease [Candidatus Edwardsbacteria bacterium]